MNTLTNEQTAKVFAMYAPCMVEHTDFRGVKETAKLIAIDFSTGDLVCTEPSGGMYDYNIQNCQLILTPLSSISDEHAIGICEILDYMTADVTVADAIEYKRINQIARGKEIAEFLSSKRTYDKPMGNNWQNYLKITDFLRSKFYHLPYAGIDLYEAGIAVKPSEI